MSTEREIPIKNLEAAFHHLSFVQESSPQFIELSEKPNVSFLHQLTEFSHEAVLFKVDDCWYGFPGMEDGFSSVWIPKTASVIIHSHGQNKIAFLPSIFDLANCSEEAVNGIVSVKGLTIFSPPKTNSPKGRPSSYHDRIRVLVAASPQESREQYIEFLKRAGAEWQVYPWEELTDEKLEEILANPSIIPSAF